MYTSDSNNFLEIFTIVQGIIIFIMMIVFFVMGSNVSKIKQLLIGNKSHEYYESLARREAFKGDTKKAVEFLHEAIYVFINNGDNQWQKKFNYEYVKKITIKINSYGGVVSKNLADKIEEYSKKYDK
jgi:predicted metalloprotease